MALSKRGSNWHYSFEKGGKRFQGSCDTGNRADAEKIQEQLRSGHASRTVVGRDPGVYFLHSELTGLVKIGCSMNVSQRIPDILNMNAEELKVLGCIKTPDPFTVEATIHGFFAKKHVRSEWFRITLEDVNFALQYWVRFDDANELVKEYSQYRVPEAERLYSYKDVAEMLDCAESSIRNWVRNGELKTVRAGRVIRIASNEIADWIERHRVEPVVKKAVEVQSHSASIEATPDEVI